MVGAPDDVRSCMCKAMKWIENSKGPPVTAAYDKMKGNKGCL